MTKKAKLEQFDGLATRESKLSLALYDLLNCKLLFVRSFSVKEIRETIEHNYDGGRVIVRMSFRAMPLFLVEQHLPDRIHVDVWTESEIQDMYRENCTHPMNQMLMTARNELMHAASKARKLTEQEASV